MVQAESNELPHQRRKRDPYDLPEHNKRKSNDAEYVVLIDSDAFDTIETDLEKTTQLKNAATKSFESWFNYFKKDLKLKGKTDMTWLVDHWTDVLEYIDQKSIDEWAPNTRRFHLMGLSHILLGIDKNSYRELVRPWVLESNRIAIAHREESAKGEFSEEQIQNFVSYPEMLKKRDDLYKLWQSEPTNIKWNLWHLAMAVNTYVPPLRLTAIEMKITRTLKQPPEDDNNYCWEYRPDTWAFVINHDKVEAKRKKSAEAKGKDYQRDIFYLEDELPGLKGQGKILNKVITQSLKANPRRDLFSGIRNTGERIPPTNTS